MKQGMFLLFLCYFPSQESTTDFRTAMYLLMISYYDNLTDPVLKVTLGVSDLQKSVNYWSDLLGMKIYEKDEGNQRALLGYGDNQVSPWKTSQSWRVVSP